MTVGDRSAAPSVAALVLNWNGWADLLECLESVLRLSPGVSQVIVCDNASTDQSVERLVDWAAGRLEAIPASPAMRRFSVPPVTKPIPLRVLDRADAGVAPPSPADDITLVVIETGDNLGYAAGNNVGLRYALGRGFDYVWLLNPDTVVESASLSPLIERMQSDPGLGLCGSTIRYYHAPDVVQELGGCRFHPALGISRRIGSGRPADQAVDRGDVERRLSQIHGASMFVRRRFVEDVGLLSDRYFLYCEEIDWAVRGKHRYRLGFAPDSVVFHKKGSATGSKGYRSRRSPSSTYHLWRSRLLFARAHSPVSLPGLLALALLQTLLSMATGNMERARAVTRALRGGKVR